MRVVSDSGSAVGGDSAGCASSSLKESVSVTSPSLPVLSPLKTQNLSPGTLQQVPQPGATGIR